mmetsp:Transcript_7174/g.26887  ORF Transcript_7174/g.26887 Transcript_7174/m.26887 type:complete len:375 (+) Transcript_7174:3428-4552(+)
MSSTSIPSLLPIEREDCDFLYQDLSLIFDEVFKDRKALLRSKEYKMNEFKILGVLGWGSFGVVKAVLHLATRETCAIKFLRKSVLLRANYGMDMLCKEIRALQDFHECTFLSSCFGVCETEDEFGIVQPIHRGGDLFSLIDDDTRLPEMCRLYVAAEILLGLEEMHDRRYIYRDLKSENVLIGDDMHVKLVDFGFSKQLHSPKDRAISSVGTPDYTPPEIIQRKEYGFEVDIWAFGILLFELFCKMPPFNLASTEVTTEKFLLITAGNLCFPSGCSPHLVDLVQKVLKSDPQQRPSIQAIKEHSFFACINWDEIKSLMVPNECLPQIHIDRDRPCKNFDQFDDDEGEDMEENDSDSESDFGGISQNNELGSRNT